MDVGVMIPQGWKGEFDGWRPADAWSNAIARAQQAEALGFESIWVFDHFMQNQTGFFEFLNLLRKFFESS